MTEYELKQRKRKVDFRPQKTSLTERELEILSYLPLGFTDKQIAEKLHVSRGTVNTHLGHIYRKYRKLFVSDDSYRPNVRLRALVAVWYVKNFGDPKFSYSDDKHLPEEMPEYQNGMERLSLSLQGIRDKADEMKRYMEASDLINSQKLREFFSYAAQIRDRLREVYRGLGEILDSQNIRWQVPILSEDRTIKLTIRELQILREIAKGSTDRKIAQEFSLSDGTVKTHVRKILKKLKARNRAEAAAIYATHLHYE